MQEQKREREVQNPLAPLERIQKAIPNLPSLSGVSSGIGSAWGRTISPAKAGMIYGIITPSPLKTVKVRKSNGQVVDLQLTRKDRRRLLRRTGNNSK